MYWNTQNEKLLVPCKCAVCEECMMFPGTGQCLYSGPFSGYVQADNKQHYNSKDEYNCNVPARS